MRRACEFILLLLKRLQEDRGVSLAVAANEVYYQTLNKYHTWYTATAFVLALKVCLYIHPLHHRGRQARSMKTQHIRVVVACTMVCQNSRYFALCTILIVLFCCTLHVSVLLMRLARVQCSRSWLPFVNGAPGHDAVDC